MSRFDTHLKRIYGLLSPEGVPDPAQMNNCARLGLHGQTFLPGLASLTIESNSYELWGPRADEAIATVAAMQLVCSNAERGSEILPDGSWTTSATVTLNSEAATASNTNISLTGRPLQPGRSIAARPLTV
jgi:hypothetical protein